MALMSCQGVSFAYEGKVVASELDFEIESGNYLCVIGENGSGKSTLMKGLLQLKQPQQGSVLLGEGLQVNEIGYLPQQTVVQKDFPASVYEVVLSGRLAKKGVLPFYSSADRATAERHIERLGIQSLSRCCYRELSGGQQQRVLLARALCATEKVLLLDEPVAGLDPMVTQELYELIEQINRDMGLTIIMVSHDIQSVCQYASHILHLKNRQVFFGKTADYLRTEIGQAFIGHSGGKHDG